MSTPTTHYALAKPTVGGESSSWGTELNADLDSIDTIIYNLSQSVLNASNLNSGTISAALLPSINAAELNGQAAAYYLNASNISAGTLSVARMPTSGISAAWITTGVLPAAQLPSVVPQVQGGHTRTNITYSTSAPSGGTDGDLWFTYS